MFGDDMFGKKLTTFKFFITIETFPNLFLS